MSYTKNEAYIDNDTWEENKVSIMLPHSCDEWVIGDQKAAQQLIDDLRALVTQIDEVESSKKLLHKLKLCHKAKLGYNCRGRNNYGECK